MSNCVEIYNPEVRIWGDAIDSLRLLQALGEHRGHDGNCASAWMETGKSNGMVGLMCDAARWFLVPGKNLTVGADGSVTVLLGRGRSGHTNRDLAHTLEVLAWFLRRPLNLSLLMSDEFDGHKSRFRRKYELRPGQRVERAGL